MAAETLLLDLDGTVWNSRAWYADAIAQLSSAQASEIATRLEAGESVPGVSRDYGVSDTRLARAASENGTSIELYERVFDTLDRLPSKGNRDRDRLESVWVVGQALAGIDRYRGVRHGHRDPPVGRARQTETAWHQESP